jgi:hypothetical protein
MYRIIGADGKEYGPITGEQVRLWIAEGRANAQTRVQSENSTEWQPISAFPEFAAALNPVPPSSGTISSDPGREAALRAVQGPAKGLLVTAITGFFVVAIEFVTNVASILHPQAMVPPPGLDPMQQQWFDALQGFAGFIGVAGIVQCVIGAIVGVVVLLGASKMQRLESYGLVYAACLLALVPCVSPCCCLGLPLGIWALVVLNKPEVKSYFR